MRSALVQRSWWISESRCIGMFRPRSVLCAQWSSLTCRGSRNHSDRRILPVTLRCATPFRPRSRTASGNGTWTATNASSTPALWMWSALTPVERRAVPGLRQIAQRVEAARRQANAHAWSSAIISAASLAISFSSPIGRLFEVKPLRNPMQHDLVAAPIEPVEGWMQPPSGPGLGIEVLEDVVDHYRFDRGA
jgi:Enolase C-terminal domain-like